MKLQKFVTRAGVLSRRQADKIIIDGRVRVNGRVENKPFQTINIELDKVTLDRKILVLPQTQDIVILLHKPSGYITSEKDPRNRPLVKDLLKRIPKQRLFSIGRLDYNTEGLILFTNNGDIAYNLSHPRFKIPRTYRVKVHGVVTSKHLNRLMQGFKVPEMGYFKGCNTKIERTTGKNTWLIMMIRQGKNREIKRVLGHIGFTVVKLIRIKYGPFRLTGIPRGQYRFLTEGEMLSLLKYIAKRKPKKDFMSGGDSTNDNR